MTILPIVPMQAESLEPGKLYIWALPHGENKVVKLNPDQDGISEYDAFDEEGDFWYFEDHLVGSLHGPFELAVS